MERCDSNELDGSSGGEYPCTGRIIAGQKFVPGGHLPVIPDPKYIHVACDHLRIDDWVIPYHHITKGSLRNLHKSAQMWSKNSGPTASEELSNAVIQQFLKRLDTL